MAAGILLDSWITGLPVVPRRTSGNGREIARAAGVLELPLGGDAGEIAPVWRSMDHGKPVVNGYSGYDPPHHRLLRLALERHDTAVLAGVAEFGHPVAIDTESAEAGLEHRSPPASRHPR